MILSGHQPVYLPGIILFNKIALSDAFMFVGHVQMSPKSWQQRNRIALNGREVMLTVPVGGTFGQTIDDAPILDAGWRRKHLGTIRQAYQKRPHFKLYYPTLEAIINEPFTGLGSLNRALIAQCCAWLSIVTPFYDSQDFKGPGGQSSIRSHKTEMLVEMVRAVNATDYLSNEGARAYVDEPLMQQHGIGHHWQLFEHPCYPQGQEPFMENLSIIDLLFNVGPAAAEIVRSCGRIAPGVFADSEQDGSRCS